MNNHILPVTGHLPVAKLKPRHFIDLLKSIEQKGLLEVAARYTSMLDYFRFKRVKQEIANSIVPNLCRLAGPHTVDCCGNVCRGSPGFFDEAVPVFQTQSDVGAEKSINSSPMQAML